MNRTIIAITLAVILSPLSVMAFDEDEERHYRVAAELLEVLGMEKKVAETVEDMVAEHLRGSSPSQAKVNHVRSLYLKYMGWDALENEMLDLFTAEFSEKEMRGMTDFYLTETGQKALVIVPQLYLEGVSIGRARVMERLKEITE